MRYILTGLLVLMAAVVLFATGCERVAQAPADPGKNDPGSYREDVAEVVVSASEMPEVVVYASWPSAPVALSALPSTLSAN